MKSWPLASLSVPARLFSSTAPGGKCPRERDWQSGTGEGEERPLLPGTATGLLRNGWPLSLSARSCAQIPNGPEEQNHGSELHVFQGAPGDPRIAHPGVAGAESARSPSALAPGELPPCVLGHRWLKESQQVPQVCHTANPCLSVGWNPMLQTSWDRESVLCSCAPLLPLTPPPPTILVRPRGGSGSGSGSVMVEPRQCLSPAPLHPQAMLNR